MNDIICINAIIFINDINIFKVMAIIFINVSALMYIYDDVRA